MRCVTFRLDAIPHLLALGRQHLLGYLAAQANVHFLRSVAVFLGESLHDGVLEFGMLHVKPEVGGALGRIRLLVRTQASQEREVWVAVDSYGGRTLAAEPPFDFLHTN